MLSKPLPQSHTIGLQTFCDHVDGGCELTICYKKVQLAIQMSWPECLPLEDPEIAADSHRPGHLRGGNMHFGGLR